MKARIAVVPIFMSYSAPLNDSGFYVAWQMSQSLADMGHRVYLLLPETLKKHRGASA